MSQTLSLGYNRTHPSSSPHEAFSIEFERYRCLSADPIRSLCRSCGYSHVNSASHPFPSSWHWELCVCFWTLIDLTPWELAAWSIRCSFQKPGHFGKYMLKMAAPQSSSFWRTSWTGNFRSPPFPPPPELLCATCSSCVFRPEISGIVRRVRILLAKTKLYLAHKSHSVSITLPPLTSPFMLRYLMLSLQPSQQLRSMDKRTKRLNGLVKVTGQVLERWPEFGIAWCCHFQALHVTLSMLLDILRFSYGRKKNFVGEECLHRQPGISLIFLSDFKSLLTQCCTVQRKCFTSRNVMVAEVILSHPLEVFLFASSEVSLGFKLYNASLKTVIKRAPSFLKSQHPNRAFIVSILKGKNWEDWRCNLGCAGALFSGNLKLLLMLLFCFHVLKTLYQRQLSWLYDDSVS